MKLANIKLSSYCLLAMVLLQTVACKKDYTDPSKAPKDDALTTSQGMTNVAIGLQRVYTFGRAGVLYNLVTTDGFTTKQLLILNQGNTAEAQLYSGGTTVDPTNTVLQNLWTYNGKVLFDANNVLNNAPELADKAYASGLIAYTTIFKALALGNLATFWEQIPDTSGVDVNFITSKAGFTKAVTMIDNALAAINVNPISPAFLAKLPAGIDVVNTLYALKARYALAAENYDAALDAANKVDLTKKSTFNFDNLILNPIWETAASNVNVYQAADSTMGLPPALEPELTDKRVPFYMSISATGHRYRLKGFASLSATAWPIYLPGEIRLIKAEVYLQRDEIPDAVVWLNSVRTKTQAADPFGVGAEQPPYVGADPVAIKAEIYRQRAIELYLSGLRLQDQRRLDRAASERKRNWMPYPFVERDNNPNTPADPPN